MKRFSKLKLETLKQIEIDYKMIKLYPNFSNGSSTILVSSILMNRIINKDFNYNTIKQIVFTNLKHKDMKSFKVSFARCVNQLHKENLIERFAEVNFNLNIPVQKTNGKLLKITQDGVDFQKSSKKLITEFMVTDKNLKCIGCKKNIEAGEMCEVTQVKQKCFDTEIVSAQCYECCMKTYHTTILEYEEKENHFQKIQKEMKPLFQWLDSPAGQKFQLADSLNKK